jgi:predicted DNA-binding antitoxin AbrB/MazE fold protein
MLSTHWGIIQQGKIQLLDKINFPEGTKVLVTIIPEEEREFWLSTSDSSLASIWNNPEDDIYEQLLQK